MNDRTFRKLKKSANSSTTTFGEFFLCHLWGRDMDQRNEDMKVMSGFQMLQKVGRETCDFLVERIREDPNCKLSKREQTIVDLMMSGF